MNSIHADTNKPNWADAPDWAQWLAQDVCGEWSWYYSRPSPVCGAWHSSYDSETAANGEHNANWETTLERRPESLPSADDVRGILTWGAESVEPDLIIPSGLDFDIRFLREAREKGYRIEWDSSNGIRGWKE